MVSNERLRSRTPLTLILGATLAGFVFGCSTVSVDNDYDPAVDFGNLKTFAWIEKQSTDEAPTIADNTLLSDRIERSVHAVLETTGLSQAPRGEADFLISQHIGVQQKLQVDTTQYGYGYGFGYGAWGGPIGGFPSQTTVSQYEQGTLVIDFVRPENKNLIWRGTGQSRVRKTTSPQEREKLIREAVTKILNQFPPKKK